MRTINGFTIVEATVVITVISILLMIGFVSYNSIQVDARDNTRKGDMSRIQDALERYYRDNGEYPAACPSYNVGCPIDNLGSYLVPKYLENIPYDPRFHNNPSGSYIDYEYVHTNVPTSYGVRVSFEGITPNFCLVGKNMEPTWYGTGVGPCDSFADTEL